MTQASNKTRVANGCLEEVAAELAKVKNGELALKGLLENGPQKVFARNKNGKYLYVNENLARDYKLPGAEIIAGIAVALTAFFASNVRADDSSEPAYSLHGFGTLGVTHSSEDKADYVGTFFQPNGAGHWRSWVASTDSKLGVQLDARFSDKLSGVIQVASQYDWDSSYTPQIEWANLAYRVTPNFTLRAGRFVTSTFLTSETRLVGYTYPWIRPPEEVYFTLPPTNKDGVDALYRFSAGNAVDTIQLSYGRANKKIPGNGEAVANHYLDVHNTWEHGATTVRLGYTSMDIDFHHPVLDGLFDGLVQFGNAVPGPAGQQALALGNGGRAVNAPYSIVTIGMSHDPGDWLLMAEWARTRASAFVSNTTAWYITGAYRIGKFTPYATVADSKPDKLPVPSIPTAGLPLPAAAAAAALNGGLAATFNAFAFAQHSVSAGLRWDFHKDVDLKLQYQRLRTDPGSPGRLTNVQPGFQAGRAVNVFSLTVDFVF